MCNAKHHPSNCRCGWGGEGHSGKSNKPKENDTRKGIYSGDNFCHPTKCHYCGAFIFFVQYNGGSVWFEELGKSWRKHECYYSDENFQQTEWEVWLKTYIDDSERKNYAEWWLKLQWMIAEDNARRAALPKTKEERVEAERKKLIAEREAKKEARAKKQQLEDKAKRDIRNALKYERRMQRRLQEAKQKIEEDMPIVISTID